MSLLPAHSRRNGGADDERPADDASADGERPATGTPGDETGAAGGPKPGAPPLRLRVRAARRHA